MIFRFRDETYSLKQLVCFHINNFLVVKQKVLYHKDRLSKTIYAYVIHDFEETVHVLNMFI